MRIFLPARFACSTTSTRLPRRPAAIAHMRPAAPAPTISASKASAMRSARRLRGSHARDRIERDLGMFAENLYLAILDQALQAHVARRHRGERGHCADGNVDHAQILHAFEL